MRSSTRSPIWALPFFLASPVLSQVEAPTGTGGLPEGQRAHLGVALGPVPDSLRSHLGIEGGALVQEVLPGSPADKAGLRVHDVVLSLDGAPVGGPEEVKGRIQRARPGDTVKLSVRRGSESLELQAILGASPPPAVEKPIPEKERKEKTREPGFLGVGYSEVPESLAFHLGLEEGVGVVVGDVWKGSPAEKAGIHSRDVLVALDGKELRGAADFLQSLGARKAGEEVSIDLFHKGQRKSLKVVLGERPRDLPREGLWPRGEWDDSLWKPRSSRRGRIIFRGPDGQEHSIQIPEGVFKAREDVEGILRGLESEFEEFKDVRIPEMKEQLRRALKELDSKLKEDDGAAEDEVISSSESRSAVMHHVDGEWDITVRDQDGARTITVLQGPEGSRKPLAKDLAWEKRETLAPEARERVEKVAASLPPAPRAAAPHPTEPRIRLAPAGRIRA